MKLTLIALLCVCLAAVRKRPFACLECGKLYRDFPLDVVLPDEQWVRVSRRPRGDGFLCAGCIVERAAKLPGVTMAKMVLE